MSGIRDVARLAGVSVATVSRAMRGQPRVADETRIRVEEAARELGYVPSSSAASLATGRTMAVAVVVPHLSRWFVGALTQGVETVLAQEGYDVLLYDHDGRRDAHRRLLTRLLRKRVDGVLLLDVGLDGTEQEALLSLGRPVVAVGGQGECETAFPSVRIDDVCAARAATDHLIGLGHRRIAFLGLVGSAASPAATTDDRLRGYRLALCGAGLDTDPALEATGDPTVDAAGAGLRALLAVAAPPTAVLTASDELAMGALHAARRDGLRVPQDLSVVGIDGHELSAVMDLTTVRRPASDEGRLAAELLLALLRGEPVPDGPILVPTELVVRGTTAPPPRVESVSAPTLSR